MENHQQGLYLIYISFTFEVNLAKTVGLVTKVLGIPL